MDAEFPVLIPFLAHQEGEQVVIHIKPVIDFIQVHILPFHKQVQLLLCQHHLHQVGFNASGVGKEIDVLVFR